MPGEQLPPAHHRQPEAGADIEHREIAQALGVAIEALTQAQPAGLLEQQALRADPLLQIDCRIALVEQMEIGGEDDLLKPFIHQPRHADADGMHRAIGILEQSAAVEFDRVEQLLIGQRRDEPARACFLHASIEPRSDHAAGGGIDHHAQNHCRHGRHLHQPSRPAEGLPERIDFLHQPALQKRLDHLRHGGGGETTGAGQ